MSTFVDELKREHRLRYRYILATDIQRIRNRVLRHNRIDAEPPSEPILISKFALHPGRKTTKNIPLPHSPLHERT